MSTEVLETKKVDPLLAEIRKISALESPPKEAFLTFLLQNRHSIVKQCDEKELDKVCENYLIDKQTNCLVTSPVLSLFINRDQKVFVFNICLFVLNNPTKANYNAISVILDFFKWKYPTLHVTRAQLESVIEFS